nr:hypothetical protein [Tanacetum cinerariifolium]
MGEVDIETLTIEQYLMLTQGNQASGMVKSKEMMEKDIKDMTIAEYMEYEAETKSNPRGMLDSIFPQNMKIGISILFIMIREGYETLEEDTDYISDDEPEIGEQKPFTPKPQCEDGEVSSDEDLDDWLKTEMEKYMCGQDKENEKDALVAILKSLVGECKEFYASKGHK